MNQSYSDFLEAKKHSIGSFGFKTIWTPEKAFDFQNYIIDKTLYRGRSGVFADTGLGKTLMQLSLAYNVALKTNKKSETKKKTHKNQ